MQLFGMEMSKLAPRLRMFPMKKMQIAKMELNQKLVGNLKNFETVPKVVIFGNPIGWGQSKGLGYAR